MRPRRSSMWSAMHSFLFLLLIMIAVAAVALSAIALYRIVILTEPPALPTGVEAEACSDSNACTLDLLVMEYGHTSCVRRDLPDGSPCDSSCYSGEECVAGECVGTCRGNCELTAFDCPAIRATDLSSTGFGRDPGDSIKLIKQCLFNICFYTIDMEILNTTASDSSVVSEIEKLITTTTGITNSSIGGSFESKDHKMIEIACMGFIIEADRDCLTPVSVEMKVIIDTLELKCSYVYECIDPPSYPGSLSFPAAVA